MQVPTSAIAYVRSASTEGKARQLRALSDQENLIKKMRPYRWREVAYDTEVHVRSENGLEVAFRRHNCDAHRNAKPSLALECLSDNGERAFRIVATAWRTLIGRFVLRFLL